MTDTAKGKAGGLVDEPDSKPSRRSARRRRDARSSVDRTALIGQHKFTPYVLSLPAVLMVLVLLAFPALYASWGSLFATDTIGGQPYFVGIQHYIDLFTDPDFLRSANRTLVFVGGCLIIGMSLAIVFAFALNKAIGGLRILRGLTILPYVVSGVAAAVMFRLLFNDDFGWVSRFLGLFGIENVGWFVDPTTAMFVVIIAQVWTDLPLAVLLILGGLQTVDPALLDAADVDGASGWSRAWRISLPLVAPQLVLATIWFSYSTLTALGVVLALTGGGPLGATRTLPVTLYETAFRNFDTYPALAIVVIVLGLNALLTLLYFILGRRFDIGD